MDKKRRLFLITVFIFLSAALGYHSGVWAKNFKPSQGYEKVTSNAPPTSVAPQATPSAPEVKLLFIFSQSEGESSQVLQGIWYTVVNPRVERLYWFPLYPQNGLVNEETNSLIQRKYQRQADQPLDPSFIQTLQEAAQTHWDKVILLDQNDLAEMVDKLGGISLNGATLTGNQAAEKMVLPSATEGRNILEQQAEMIQALCNRRNELHGQPPLKSSAEWFRQRWQGEEKDSRADQALEVFLNLINRVNSLQCEFIGV